MKLAVIIWTLFYVLSKGIVIDTTTSDPFATVTLTNDPRNINKIWMDGPHGEKDSEGWSTRGTIWHSTSILTSGLGVLLCLLTFGAAVFNMKRLAFGRLHKSRKKTDSTE